MSQQKIIDVLKRLGKLGIFTIAKEAGLGTSSASVNLKSLIKQGIVERNLEKRRESFLGRGKGRTKKKVFRNRFRYMYKLR